MRKTVNSNYFKGLCIITLTEVGVDVGVVVGIVVGV